MSCCARPRWPSSPRRPVCPAISWCGRSGPRSGCLPAPTATAFKTPARALREADSDAEGRRNAGFAVSRKGWVLFATMCVVWGIPYLLIKVAVGGVGVPVVVFGRTALGALLLLPFALRSGQLATLRRHWRPLVAFTALEMIGPWGLLSQAERKLPSSLAGLLIAAVPILGVVIARLTGGTERLSPRRWTGLLVGLAGVVVLAAPYLSSGSIWPVGE